MINHWLLIIITSRQLRAHVLVCSILVLLDRSCTALVSSPAPPFGWSERERRRVRVRSFSPFRSTQKEGLGTRLVLHSILYIYTVRQLCSLRTINTGRHAWQREIPGIPQETLIQLLCNIKRQQQLFSAKTEVQGSCYILSL